VKVGFIWCASLLVAGCAGDITGGAGDDPDAGSAAANLTITSPAPASSFVRDQLSDLGALIAPVPVGVTPEGPITRVVLELSGQGAVAELTGAPWSESLELDGAGDQTLTAIGYGGDGVELARAEVAFTVVEPTPADCHAWLDLYGIDYTLGPDNQGVSDPVTVTTPINGMVYRYSGNSSPRSTFFMDCTLARSLAAAAPLLRARDVVEVTDIGVYNYRCIGGGTPPDCPNGISQHAYAKAIDLAGFTTSDDSFYSVNDDWVIDPSTETTCTAATEGGKDEWLHETICELKAHRVWNIVLTPNYNADHRNHFHVDLTPNADFIRDAGSPIDVGLDDY